MNPKIKYIIAVDSLYFRAKTKTVTTPFEFGKVALYQHCRG